MSKWRKDWQDSEAIKRPKKKGGPAGWPKDYSKNGGARPHPEASRWRGGNRLNEK